jgi:hypothetical protein
MTPEDRDFCANCGAYLRWDDPEPDDEPTAVIYDVPEEAAATTEMEVEPPPAVEPAAAVRVSLMRPEDPGAGAEPPTVLVEAGGRVRLTGIVFNQSGVVDGFDLRIAGLDPAWWTVAPATVDLVPFGAADGVPEQRVEVHLHPPRAPEAEARAWEIALVARSRTNGADAAVGRGTLTIQPYEQLECRVRPQTLRDRRSGRLAVPVRNLGNAPTQVRFEGEDDEGALDFAFAPPLLTLPPGGEGHAQLTVTARRPVRGAPCHRRLTIAAEGARERAERQATFIQEPEVVRSHRFAWRVGLTLAAAFLLVAGAFLKWDDVDKGICTSADSTCLSFDRYLARANIATVDSIHSNTAANLVAAATSIGILAALFGVLVLLGARRGGLTWVAGFLAVLLAVAMFATIGAAGIGVWFVLLGGVAAVAAGALARA